jgi:hypothetical protein
MREYLMVWLAILGMRLSPIWEKIIKNWPNILGLILLVIGVLGYLIDPLPFMSKINDVYLEIRSELIGIGITVLIIDNANKFVRIREEKKRLILQMGSPDNAFAVEAVRQLRERGWLIDGSIRQKSLYQANLSGANLVSASLVGTFLMDAVLKGADLMGADLKFTNLINADLREAKLTKVNLQGSDLRGANLEGAYLNEANLYKADLWGAKLKGANLIDANVKNGQLIYVKTLCKAIMPDGRKYDGRLRLKEDLLGAEEKWMYSGEKPRYRFMRYYDVSEDDYMAGQVWAKENLPKLLDEEG